jgi:hypothetical protein
MQAYKADFDRQHDLAAAMKKITAAPNRGEAPATRGGGASRFSRAAEEANRQGLARSGVDALVEIGAAWQPLLESVPPAADLTSDHLNGQMEILRRTSRVKTPDPAALCDVLAFTHTPRVQA